MSKARQAGRLSGLVVAMGPASSAATIKDVARLARVLAATVWAAVNRTSFVSAPLKARVIEAVAERSFSPSRLARGLRTRSTRLAGVSGADITTPFFAEFARPAGLAARPRGRGVLLCEVGHDPAKEQAALHLPAAHRVDGSCPTGPARR